MSQRTTIEWTDVTWNPTHGCSRVSTGCKNCYAEALSLRYGQTKAPWTARNAAQNVLLKPHKLREPLSKAGPWKQPCMVFVNSMSDLFHEQIPYEYIDRVFEVMAQAEQHTFQVLTKRPGGMVVAAGVWAVGERRTKGGVMPNGYTAAIYDGKPITLADYLMSVGRGMGFAIMQRDESFDAPVRHVEANTDYYDGQLAEARALLAEADALTVDEANRRAQAEYEQAVREWDETKAKRQAMRARYEAMIAEVEAWEPDPLVVGVKDAALKYLREGMDFDCGDEKESMRWYPYPKRLSGPDWINEKRAKAKRDIEYAAERRREEIERTDERNRYIDAFLSSLPDRQAVS